jgi:hypothetical protein
MSVDVNAILNAKPGKPIKPKNVPATISKSAFTVVSQLDDEAIVVRVDRSKWYIHTNGVVCVQTGEHTFRCSWGLDGSVSAVLYGKIPDLTKTMTSILMDRSVRLFLSKYSKRPLPSNLAIVE